ncbi:MAG: glycosyltransferase family 2 protein [Bacteroidota bacterium]
MKPLISLVIPLYNEEETISILVERLNKLIDRLDIEIEVVLINDGSEDRTEELIYAIGLQDKRYQIISLARNFGHQIALSAGLKYANAQEAVFILDGDLQDPPELLETFYKHFKEGYDVVYGVRKKRKENFFKRSAYYLFYRMLKSISSIDIPIDSGDFSLISRKVVDIINAMPEESRYIRGMRAWTGFKQIGVEYEREGRAAGNSKYSLRNLMNLAYNGIFNFSEFPIKLIARCGFLAFGISLTYSFYALFMKIMYDTAPEGFTTLIFAITMFGGIQLLSIGILGEYITRTFFQVKQRPLFIVKSRIESQNRIERQH